MKFFFLIRSQQTRGRLHYSSDFCFFFSSRRRHTRCSRDWSSDVCSSDLPIADNLREIAEVKRNYPKHACVASLMVESKREAWHEMVKQTQDTGADGIELKIGRASCRERCRSRWSPYH